MAAAGGVLCPVAGGGEEGRTQGLKLCTQRVVAMLGLGKRWRGCRIYATPVKQNSKKKKKSENVHKRMRKCNHN